MYLVFNFFLNEWKTEQLAIFSMLFYTFLICILIWFIWMHFVVHGYGLVGMLMEKSKNLFHPSEKKSVQLYIKPHEAYVDLAIFMFETVCCFYAI